MNYVDQYLRLEDKASTAESRAEEYRQRAEENRWEQCRLAHGAVESGEYSRRTFAEAVGVGHSTINRQCKAWAANGPLAVHRRPSYSDAIAAADGLTVSDETQRKQVVNARAVLRDPELAREVLQKDAHARAVVDTALGDIEREQPKPKPKAPTGDAAFLDCMDQMVRAKQSLARLVENLNEGRRNGFLTPAVLREFVGELRLYADAIEEIAGSRGLTDEALAEWIGVE